jgi:deoxyribonuclease IV
MTDWQKNWTLRSVLGKITQEEFGMIRFGPAGNSNSFYAQGHKHTTEAFAWITQMGLDAFEYSFGRGVQLSQETAETIGEAAAMQSVALSVHAPYYINLATDDLDKAAANIRYLMQSVKAAQWMGAQRIVFHPGSPGKLEYGEAFTRVKAALLVAAEELGSLIDDVALCPETMGRPKQIGSLEETIALCQLDSRLIPALDFGHLHARGKGAINTEQDYADILDKLEAGLGKQRAKRFHIHFSHIQYTAAGEKMHRTFADEGFGPDFAPLARQLILRGMEPTVICESQGTMAEDATEMKRTYMEEKAKYEG